VQKKMTNSVKNKIKFIKLAFFLCSVTLTAQENDSLPHYINFTATGTYNRTDNYDSYLFSNGLNYSIRRKDLRANFNNKWLFGKQQTMLVNNDFSSSFDLNWYKTFPHFNYWLLLNYNRTYSLKINHQLQYGLGVAYNLVHRSWITLNVSDGVINEYSDVYIKDSERTIYQTLRNSFRLQLKVHIGERIRFSSVGFLQSSLRDHNDYILKQETTALFKLRKWLSLTARFTFDRMNHTGRENIFLTYGLTVENHF
jgi:hypothetical protein